MKTKKAAIGAFSFLLFCGFFVAFSQTTFAGAAAGGCTDEDNDGYFLTDCPTRLNFKGIEKQICDCPEIAVGKKCAGAVLTENQIFEIFDPTKHSNKRGRQFHPGVPDAPDDGIDQDCDGQDEETTTTFSLIDLIETGVNILSVLVAGISTMILIWGGIMYATAAGEEEKTRKARKAMIGAVIGLIIGILASQIVKLVISYVNPNR